MIRQVLAEMRETLSVTQGVVTITKSVAQVGLEFKLKKLLKCPIAQRTDLTDRSI
ncbi:MAG: hypothetical protein ACE5GX_20460 [Thermoanaerobaculia bacterium]